MRACADQVSAAGRAKALDRPLALGRRVVFEHATREHGTHDKPIPPTPQLFFDSAVAVGSVERTVCVLIPLGFIPGGGGSS